MLKQFTLAILLALTAFTGVAAAANIDLDGDGSGAPVQAP
jgi:hypothetical protein